MSARTTLAGAVVLAALAGAALYEFGGVPGYSSDEDERNVVLVALVDKGRGHLQWHGDGGMQYVTFGTKVTSQMKEPYEKGHWTKTILVKPGTLVRMILSAEEVTDAHCGIRSPFLKEEAPHITPLDQHTETVECSATIP